MNRSRLIEILNDSILKLQVYAIADLILDEIEKGSVPVTPEAEREGALSPGDFGLLLQGILRQFAREVEASPVRPGMSVEEFSPRFEAMRFASQAIMSAASRLTAPTSPSKSSGEDTDWGLVYGGGTET